VCERERDRERERERESQNDLLEVKKYGKLHDVCLLEA